MKAHGSRGPSVIHGSLCKCLRFLIAFSLGNFASKLYRWYIYYIYYIFQMVFVIFLPINVPVLANKGEERKEIKKEGEQGRESGRGKNEAKEEERRKNHWGRLISSQPKILQREEVSCKPEENTSGDSLGPRQVPFPHPAWSQPFLPSIPSPSPTHIPTNLPSLNTKSEMMSKGWMWTADRIMVTVFCGSLEASEMVCWAWHS